MTFPAKYHEVRIALASESIRWSLARRLSDPISAAYMRDCIRHAIAAIRVDAAALGQTAALPPRVQQ
jgi:hypothetical protein